ncbi:unnamed protein product [Rhizophagus irregularis]|nr:unnamed protein product [Rhizophagus irregularis]
MLTSLITANTPRDANHVKPVGGEALNKPMTDSEICGVIFDGFLGGTDTTANTISSSACQDLVVYVGVDITV